MLSRKAFKEVKTEEETVSDNKLCIICQESYEDSDVIDMNLEGPEL